MKKAIRGKNWTKKEVDYLNGAWGNYPVSRCANKLHRTKTAIIVKSKRLGLGGAYQSGDKISAQQVSYMLGVDIHTVTDYWVDKCGLKASKTIMRLKRKIHLIDFETLVDWLKNNPAKWDSRKVKKFGFGLEYDWLKEKRILDSYQPKRRFQKWTAEEVSKLKFYFREGKKVREMAILLERSNNAVERKLSKIDIWGISFRNQNLVKANK